MQLLPFATEVHVTEALRLFQVSTLDAAMTGSLAGKFTHEIIAIGDNKYFLVSRISTTNINLTTPEMLF